MTVLEYAQQLDLWHRVGSAVQSFCDAEQGLRLMEQVGRIPVRSSRATSRLGCYVFQGSKAICIRLQFAQESERLRETFLHEIAHACDHLHEKSRSRRQAHGKSWRQWAKLLGISSVTRGESQAVAALHQRRKKLVAVCQNCGVRIYRIRQLNRHSRYIHPACGGQLEAVRG